MVKSMKNDQNRVKIEKNLEKISKNHRKERKLRNIIFWGTFLVWGGRQNDEKWSFTTDKRDQFLFFAHPDLTTSPPMFTESFLARDICLTNLTYEEKVNEKNFFWSSHLSLYLGSNTDRQVEITAKRPKSDQNWKKSQKNHRKVGKMTNIIFWESSLV